MKNQQSSSNSQSNNTSVVSILIMCAIAIVLVIIYFAGAAEIDVEEVGESVYPAAIGLGVCALVLATISAKKMQRIYFPVL